MNQTRRIRCISEILRLLRPGGRALVYAWARDQERHKKASSYLKQKNPKAKEGKSEATEERAVKCAISQSLELPVHTNRTVFKHADLLVPWKTKGKEAEVQNGGETFHRFYHVFEEGELEELILSVEEASIVSSYYDQGNWCCVFQRE